MQPKPVRNPVVTLQRQLEQAISGQFANRKPSPSELIVTRLMMALAITKEVLMQLMAFHPHARILEMDREEIEAWMASGAPPITDTSTPEYFDHVARLLSDISLNFAEISQLSTDVEFLAMLQRLSPGTHILQLDAISRAFVIYCQHTIGWECPQHEIDKAVWDYPRISKALAEAIEFDAIATLLKDPESDWREFFDTLIEPAQPKPQLTNDQIRAKFAKEARKYAQLPEWMEK
jgi:hypothetical protein